MTNDTAGAVGAHRAPTPTHGLPALPVEGDAQQLFIDSVQDYAIILLDVEGRIRSWNTGAARIKGYTADEIVGQHFSRFYPEEDV
jgi:PAS domain-containing protein